MNPQNTKKMIVVLGPTASGKSDLAVRLAKKWNGEVVSADSRQVYKGLNIGTGKITKREMRGIPHHLIDVASPTKTFTVAQYKKLADKSIGRIWSRGKLPIICGGTGFYVRAVIDNLLIPKVPPNKKLREYLDKKTASELFAMLKKLDQRRAGEIDAKNPRRLIRAIEIAKHLGKVPALTIRQRNDCDILEIGIVINNEELKTRIKKRLLARIKHGMIDEAKRLYKQGMSLRRMNDLGLEYRYLAKYLNGEISKKEMIIKLEKEIWQYAKRQRTWFKKDKRIRWFTLSEVEGFASLKNKKIEKEVRVFLI